MVSDRHRNGVSWGALALLAGVLLISAEVSTQIWLARNNTLHSGGRWISGKIELALGLLGAVSALTSRTALQHDRLHPGVWHGFHEFLYHEPVALRSLAADFVVRGPHHLTFEAARTDTGFFGVRVSRTPAHPSACLSGRNDGAFVRRDLLPEKHLDEGWHRLQLEVGTDATRVDIDGELWGTCDFDAAKASAPGHFGFRGSRGKRVAVDNVLAQTVDGREIREDFANRRGIGRVRLAMLAGVLGVIGSMLGARRLCGRRMTARPLLYALATAFVVMITATLAYAVNAFVLARIHPAVVDFAGYPNRVEYEAAVLARVRADYSPEKPAGVHRIVLLGTSQTWGAGARTPEETTAQRLERALNRAARAGARVEIINLGISGYVSQQLYDLYEAEFVAWDPDTVIAIFGTNDGDVEKFRVALDHLVRLNVERGVRTVFIPEPNNVETPGGDAGLRSRHAVMRDLAAREKVPLIEVHDPLVARADEGFLWWDVVHLSSFGQELLAELLFEAKHVLLPELFEADRPTGS